MAKFIVNNEGGFYAKAGRQTNTNKFMVGNFGGFWSVGSVSVWIYPRIILMPIANQFLLADLPR